MNRRRLPNIKFHICCRSQLTLEVAKLNLSGAAVARSTNEIESEKQEAEDDLDCSKFTLDETISDIDSFNKRKYELQQQTLG